MFWFVKSVYLASQDVGGFQRKLTSQSCSHCMPRDFGRPLQSNIGHDEEIEEVDVQDESKNINCCKRLGDDA